MLKLVVETTKIQFNYEFISRFLAHYKLKMILSLKALAGQKDLLKKISELFTNLPVADSRVVHFQRNDFSSREKIFMNIPPIFSSQLYIEIVKNTDICYVSRVQHLRLLEEACRYLHKPFQVILFVNTGENREGYHIRRDRKAIESCIEYLSQVSYISLAGIATNIGCISEKIPSAQTTTEFETFCTEVEKKFSLKLKYIIGGSSNFLPLLEKGFVPKKINTVCLGGALLLGDIPSYQESEGNIQLKQDIFHLYALICDIKKIPIRSLRLLLYIGKNDIHPSDLVWDEVEFVGISSDYMIVIIPEANFQKHVIQGEFAFVLKYAAVPKILASPYTNLCLY